MNMVKKVNNFLSKLFVEKQRWLWDGIFWGSSLPGLGMGIFHFVLDQKIVDSEYPIEIPEKFPIRWGFGIFEGLGIF